MSRPAPDPPRWINMISGFNDAIEEGTWSGIVQGMWEQKLMPDEAREFLSRDNYEAITPKEKGIREGLLAIGFLHRDWLRRYRRTSPTPIGEETK